MNVTPKTEEEVSQLKTWENGIYSFEILEKVKFGTKEYRTCETVSSKGDAMLVFVVQVFNDNGQSRVLVDYLVEEFAARKIRHASAVCGQLQAYQAGQLDPLAFIGKCGKVKLYTQKGKPKEEGEGNWPDKNAIGDYIVEEEDTPQVNGAVSPSAVAAVMDDTIPF